jgi:hypothetical protein
MELEALLLWEEGFGNDSDNDNSHPPPPSSAAAVCFSSPRYTCIFDIYPPFRHKRITKEKEDNRLMKCPVTE